MNANSAPAHPKAHHDRTTGRTKHSRVVPKCFKLCVVLIVICSVLTHSWIPSLFVACLNTSVPLACCLCLVDRALAESGACSDVWNVWYSSARCTIVHWSLCTVEHDIHSRSFFFVFSLGNSFLFSRMSACVVASCFGSSLLLSTIFTLSFDLCFLGSSFLFNVSKVLQI